MLKTFFLVVILWINGSSSSPLERDERVLRGLGDSLSRKCSVDCGMANRGHVFLLPIVCFVLYTNLTASLCPTTAMTTPAPPTGCPADKPYCNCPIDKPNCNCPPNNPNCNCPPNKPNCNCPADNPNCNCPPEKPNCNCPPNNPDCNCPPEKPNCNCPPSNPNCNCPPGNATCNCPVGDPTMCKKFSRLPVALYDLDDNFLIGKGTFDNSINDRVQFLQRLFLKNTEYIAVKILDNNSVEIVDKEKLQAVLALK